MSLTKIFKLTILIVWCQTNPAMTQASACKSGILINKLNIDRFVNLSMKSSIRTVIDSCPLYPWNNKNWCGPTSVGNLFAYYDLKGFDDLFPGDLKTASWGSISEWMSSKEHSSDYYIPWDGDPPYTIKPDKSEPPIGDEHPDNCIADFIGSGYSFYGCSGASTKSYRMKDGIQNYVQHFAPDYKSDCKEYSFDNFPWDSLVNNINCDKPLVALVKMNYDSSLGDHWTVVIGYKVVGDKKYYGCVSLQGSLIWFPYTQVYEDVTKEQWRIVNIYTFSIHQLPYLEGNIQGLSVVCQGTKSVKYTYYPQGNFDSYVWIIPPGAAGSSDSTSIIIDYSDSAVSGPVLAYGKNQFGKGRTSMLPVSVNPLPERPDTLFGPTRVCRGQNNVIYEVPGVLQAEDYIWGLPEGTRGTPKGKLFAIDYFSNAVSGDITICESNACGLGKPFVLKVEVSGLATPPVISLIGKTLHSSEEEGNQWFLGDSLLVGGTHQDLIPTVDGDYFTIVTDNGCSSLPSNVINIRNSGNGETCLKNDFIVFPNPVINSMTVQSGEVGDLIITDLFGKYLIRQEVNDREVQIDVSILPHGVYLIHYKTDKQLFVTKLVKQ